MQTYEVQFTPAHLSPLRISDAIRAEQLPAPHVPVGDPDIPGKGLRIPLTTRLVASLDRRSPLIGRAKAYRDPKSHRIVLGMEQADDARDNRALVLLSTKSGALGGVSVLLPKDVSLLAEGEREGGRQLLLIWPDGAGIAVEDTIREQRHELRRQGDEFARTTVKS
jgi:hypothetical protein